MTFTLSRLQRLAGIPINESRLEEGANDRYKQIFQALYNIPELQQNNSGIDELINRIIETSRSVYKKDDRVIWALRYAKVNLLSNLATGRYHNPTTLPQIQKLLDKAVKQLETKSQIDAQEVIYSSGYLEGTGFQQMEHFLSLPIPEIQNLQFGWQSAPKILQKFHEAEDIWKKQREQFVNAEPQHEVVMDFGDGWAWVNLNTAYCSAEGAAMGHCGNESGQHTDDTILSLRKTMKGGTLRPSATFILDPDGYLGEMKGRSNIKPAEKYHKYIIPLLRSDMIVGIKGGGYLPEENFSMDDLDEDTKSELIGEKPALGSLLDAYKKLGGDDETVRRWAWSNMNDMDLRIVEWKGDTIIVDTWNDTEEFLLTAEDYAVGSLYEAIYHAQDQVENAESEDKPAEEYEKWLAKLRNRLKSYYLTGYHFYVQGAALMLDGAGDIEYNKISYTIPELQFIKIISAIGGNGSEDALSTLEVIRKSHSFWGEFNDAMWSGWIVADSISSDDARGRMGLNFNDDPDELAGEYEQWHGKGLDESRKRKTRTALGESAYINKIKRLAGIHS